MNNKGHEDLKSNYLKVYLSLFLILAIYLLFALSSVGTLLRGDEIDFVLAAKGIIISGIPKYPGILLPKGVFSVHPPLYLYTMALVFKLLGVCEITARLIGILCTLGNILLVYFIAQELLKERKHSSIIALVASLIFAVNPLVIQGSLVVDIDNTVLTLATSLFLFCFVKTYRRSRLSKILILGSLFGLSLWAKLPTPLLLIISIVLFYWLKGDLQEGLSLALGIGLIGGGAFFITFYLYSYFFNFSFGQPFLYFPQRLAEYGRGFYSLKQSALLILGRLYIFFFWVSPSLVLLAFLASYFQIKKYLKQNQPELLDFLTIFSVLVFIVYTFVGSTNWGFPRYYFPMLPALSIVVSYFVVNTLSEAKWKDTLVYLVLAVASFFYLSQVVGDPLLLPFTPRRGFISQSLIAGALIRKAISVSALYLLCLAVLGLFFLVKQKGFGVVKAVSLAAIITLVSGVVSVNVIQAKASYSTRYIYGEKGMEQTVGYLRKKVVSNDLVICDREIAYYVGTRQVVDGQALVDFYGIIYNPARFKELISRYDIRFVVVRKTNVLGSPQFDEIKSLMVKRWKLVKTFGNFEIYKVTSNFEQGQLK